MTVARVSDEHYTIRERIFRATCCNSHVMLRFHLMLPTSRDVKKSFYETFFFTISVFCFLFVFYIYCS